MALSLAAAAGGGLLDARGLLALLVFAAACLTARYLGHAVLRGIAAAVVLALTAGLLLHALPGFSNPVLLQDVVLSDDAAPYTKHLSFDKGLAGLFLLGLFVPERTQRDQGLSHASRALWPFGLLLAVAVVAALATGYVRWDPKVPSWWPAWLWSMVFLTALPEEAVFRGVVQSSFAAWWGGTKRADVAATLAAGTLFGVAHAGGGPVYVVLATIAGIGYGWVYASTRSIGAAILTHAGLNSLHFFLFTYPGPR